MVTFKESKQSRNFWKRQLELPTTISRISIGAVILCLKHIFSQEAAAEDAVHRENPDGQQDSRTNTSSAALQEDRAF